MNSNLAEFLFIILQSIFQKDLLQYLEGYILYFKHVGGLYSFPFSLFIYPKMSNVFAVIRFDDRRQWILLSGIL